MNAIVDNPGGKTSEVESVIREFAPRDIRRRQRPERSVDAAGQIGLVIARVTGASFDEIDQVIATLQTMKDTLRQEGKRLQREIAGYAHRGQLRKRVPALLPPPPKGAKM